MPAAPHTTAWYEAQYNNRARVPESVALMARWAEDSRRVRGQTPAELDIAYGEGPAERLDVFLPPSVGRAPVHASGANTPRTGAPILFFIHGGWWRALDKSDHSWVAPAFTQAGALVVVPNYSLCPTVGIGDIALQMTRALAWTARHAHRLGGDVSRLVVAGHSAGGHLTAMMHACRWREVGADLPPALVQRALSISGVFDLEPLRRAPFLQVDLRLTPATVRQLSPAGFPAPASGELHLVAGALESEEFARQNRLLRRRWGAARVPTCAAVTGANHFTVLDSLAETQGQVHRLARRLLGL